MAPSGPGARARVAGAALAGAALWLPRGSRGKLTLTSVPWLGWLSTVTCPPMRATRPFTMVKPSPMLPFRSAPKLAPCQKGWPSLLSCSVLMPMPESRTKKSTESPSPGPATSCTDPFSVKRAALSSRFSST